MQSRSWQATIRIVRGPADDDTIVVPTNLDGDTRSVPAVKAAAAAAGAGPLGRTVSWRTGRRGLTALGIAKKK